MSKTRVAYYYKEDVGRECMLCACVLGVPPFAAEGRTLASPQRLCPASPLLTPLLLHFPALPHARPPPAPLSQTTTMALATQ
jgi:hypothetical protein